MSGLDDDWEILPRQTSKPKAPILTLQSSEEESRQIEEEIRRQLMSRQEREAQVQADHQNDVTDKTISREESTDSAVSVSLNTEEVNTQEQQVATAVKDDSLESTNQEINNQEILPEDNTQLSASQPPIPEPSLIDSVLNDSTIRKQPAHIENYYDGHVDALPPNTELKVIFGSLLAMAVHSIIFSPKAVEAF